MKRSLISPFNYISRSPGDAREVIRAQIEKPIWARACLRGRLALLGALRDDSLQALRARELGHLGRGRYRDHWVCYLAALCMSLSGQISRCAPPSAPSGSNRALRCRRRSQPIACSPRSSLAALVRPSLGNTFRRYIRSGFRWSSPSMRDENQLDKIPPVHAVRGFYRGRGKAAVESRSAGRRMAAVTGRHRSTRSIPLP